jgi:hypothetical protein
MVVKMKRFYTLIAVFLVMLLLSGCVTIPLADGGTIEISADGIHITEGDTKEEDSSSASAEENGDAEDDDGKEKDTQKGKQANAGDVAGSDRGMDDVDGFGGCQNEFYLLANRLPKGLPMPECAFIEFMELSEDEETDSKIILARFTAFEDLNEEIDKYQQYFKSKGFSPSVESDSTETSIAIQENDMALTVKLEQVENDLITTQIFYTESPIKEYKITESIINYTENGYGQCSDEYYTLKGVLTDYFPLPECAHIKFLTIEYFEGGMTVTGIYQIDRFWTDEYTEFDAYFKANDFDVAGSEAFTTHWEIYFEQTGVSGGLGIEKFGMDTTITTINLSKSFEE